MKRYISFLLVAALLSSVFSLFSVNVGASFPETSSMDGYENLCLTYTWNPSRSDNGRHNVEDLMPYVAYLDTKGNIQDFFFDSYLFLPCQKDGVTGAGLHYGTSNPTKALDWTSYVEDTFYEDANVDALDTAFGIVKEELNAPEKKAGVFFTILYPGKAAGASFGELGGKALDFSNIEDRKYAIKWMIDEQVRLYTEAGYENLDLVGFYWLEEYMFKGARGTEDKELFQYASEYLHSLGLKFLWIPYYHANGYSNWEELGFDIACMQPNMYWDNTRLDKSRVDSCVRECDSLGMCVEIEIDYNAIQNSSKFNSYLDYLEGCMQGGAMDSIKMYYQDGKNAVFYNACHSSDNRARSIYDLTYKYAKGTLTQEDIDTNRAEEFKLPDDVAWVSVGKDYIATAPYFDGSGSKYQDNDGTELTDGMLGTSSLGTDWHGFHKTLTDFDGRMSVTIDLGEVRTDLTDFMIQFGRAEASGVGAPADNVKIYVSEDGADFDLLAQPKLETAEYISYIHYKTEPVKARYVKYTFINSNLNFVFCGEALVGIEKKTPEEEMAGKTNVALNKPYTGAEASPVNTNYSANLTDGIANNIEQYDSNWFGFYYNSNATPDKINAPNGKGEIVIDLNEVVNGIGYVRVHVWNHNDSGISAAKSITLYTSEDSENYTKVGTLIIPGDDEPDWAYISTSNISARYVKLVVETKDVWTFLNEIEVYSDPNYVPEPDVSEPGDGDGDTEKGKLGDIDNDGDVDAADYILVKRSVLKTYKLTDEQFAVANIDKDNDVDAADYVLVKRIVLGSYTAE